MRIKLKSFNRWATFCSCLLVVGCDQISTRLQGFTVDKPKSSVSTATLDSQPILEQKESGTGHAAPHRIQGKVHTQRDFGADDTTGGTVRDAEHIENLQTGELKENEISLDRSVEFLVKDNLSVFEKIKAAPVGEIQN